MPPPRTDIIGHRGPRRFSTAATISTQPGRTGHMGTGTCRWFPYVFVGGCGPDTGRRGGCRGCVGFGLRVTGYGYRLGRWCPYVLLRDYGPTGRAPGSHPGCAGSSPAGRSPMCL